MKYPVSTLSVGFKKLPGSLSCVIRNFHLSIFSLVTIEDKIDTENLGNRFSVLVAKVAALLPTSDLSPIVFLSSWAASYRFMCIRTRRNSRAAFSQRLETFCVSWTIVDFVVEISLQNVHGKSSENHALHLIDNR